MKFICPVFIAGPLIVLSFGNSTDSRAADYRTVALSGQQAPGLQTGVLYSGFQENFDSPSDAPVINNAGETAFMASFQVGAGGVTNGDSRSVWSEQNGVAHLVARSSFAAPGANVGAVFDELRSVAISQS